MSVLDGVFTFVSLLMGALLLCAYFRIRQRHSSGLLIALALLLSGSPADAQYCRTQRIVSSHHVADYHAPVQAIAIQPVYIPAYSLGLGSGVYGAAPQPASQPAALTREDLKTVVAELLAQRDAQLRAEQIQAQSIQAQQVRTEALGNGELLGLISKLAKTLKCLDDSGVLSSSMAAGSEREPALPPEPQAPTQPPANLNLDAQAQAIFTRSCIQCHNSTKKGGGLDLTDWQQARASARQIWLEVNAGTMPRVRGDDASSTAPLSNEESELLKQWWLSLR